VIEIPGYHIKRQLGRGGMATVYLATQESVQRDVALKVMSPTLLADPDFGERFLREARIAAKLHHRIVVGVHDVGRVGDFHYIAMEYLGGGSVLSEVNRAAMRRKGFIVCFDARPETIAARLQDSTRHISERPLLGDGNPAARIVELKAERDPVYAQADFIIQTDDLTPDQVTHQVLLAFRERSAVAGGAP